MAFENATGLLP